MDAVTSQVGLPDDLPLGVAVLRRTRDRRRAEAFALGLDAAAIHAEIARRDSEWWVLVPASLAMAGEQALEGYDEEVAQANAVAAPEPAEPPSLLGPAVALGLLALFAVTGPVDSSLGPNPWFARGAALSGPILQGQWWRTITALGLHAHLAHVLGNAAMGFVLLGALGGALGPGVAALAALLTGALGNAITARWHGAGYASIGASTAIFGALGLLTAPGNWRRSRWPAWVSLGGSLALLGFLGTDDHADLAAHLSGWLLGVALGFLIAPLHRWRRALGLQLATGAVAAALVVLAVLGARAA